MNNNNESTQEIESTTSYSDYYTYIWLKQHQKPEQKIDWFGLIPIFIFTLITIFFIIKIIKTAKTNRQNRRREQAERAEAEKAERRATEERRHQEILQAIRESGKMPEDNK